jgi:hypothetical protein
MTSRMQKVFYSIFHFTPVRMAMLRGKKKQMLARMQQNRNPYTLSVGMKISTTIMENSKRKISTTIKENRKS